MNRLRAQDFLQGGFVGGCVAVLAALLLLDALDQINDVLSRFGLSVVRHGKSLIPEKRSCSSQVYVSV